MSDRVKLALAVLLALFGGCSPSFTAADAHTRLVFKIGDPSVPVDPNQLEAVRSVVELRLRLSTVFPQFIVEVREPDELIVLTPQLTDEQLSAVKDLVTRPGTLEFAVLANSRNHAQLIAAAQSADAGGIADESQQYAWIPLKTKADGQPVEFHDHDSAVVRKTEHDGKVRTEVLIVLDSADRRLTDKLLEATQRVESYETGRPTTLQFTLNTTGAYLMARLTEESLPAADGFKRRLGIILDNDLLSAPTINTVIYNRGIIQGEFTPEEVRRMVICLNVGRLPLPVEFVEVQDLRGE